MTGLRIGSMVFLDRILGLVNTTKFVQFGYFSIPISLSIKETKLATIVQHRQLLMMGNKLGLMPCTNEGWIYLAQRFGDFHPDNYTFEVELNRSGNPKVIVTKTL